MSTRERLSALLTRAFGVKPELLGDEATLESLEIDSLRLIEVLFEIEEEFGITVPADPAELRARLSTYGDLVGYIDTLVADAGAARA